MSKFGFLAAACVFALISTAPAGAQDTVTANPDLITVKADNGHVRVLEVRIPKGREVALHSHPDRIVYVVKGGTLRSFDASGKTTDYVLTPGQALSVAAQTHSAQNIGKSEIVVVEVELKDAGDLSPELSTFERGELVALLERSRDRLVEVIARADGELWSKRPGEGRWSVSEVVEHLVTSEGMIFGLAQSALAAPADANWRTVDIGNSVTALMDMMLDRSQKYPAPEPLQPQGGLSRAEATGKFFEARETTLDFVRTTKAPLKAHTADAPVGKLTAHQFLVLLAGHSARHTAQAEEALAQLAGGHAH